MSLEWGLILRNERKNNYINRYDYKKGKYYYYDRIKAKQGH